MSVQHKMFYQQNTWLFSYALKMIEALYSCDNADKFSFAEASDSSLTFPLIATLGFLVKVCYYP